MTPTDLARLAAEADLDPEARRRLVEACAEDPELAEFLLAYRDVHALTGLALAAANRDRRARTRLRVTVAAAAGLGALALALVVLRLLPAGSEIELAAIPLSPPPAVERTLPPLDADAAAVLATWTPGTSAETGWLTSMEDAQAIAAATRRPLLLYVYHPECPWCVAMNRVTWPDARVAELTAEVVPVKVNVEETSEAFRKQLEGWPWITLEESGGRVLRAFPGYREADDMSKELRAGLDARSFEEALSWDEARRLARALEAARDAEEAGRLGEAQAGYEALAEAPAAFAEESREGLRRIAEAARKALLQAQRAAQSDVTAALSRIEDAVVTFRGTSYVRDLERVREALVRTGRFPRLSPQGVVG